MARRKRNEFELFGYDFMIDQDFKVYLIEVNTNPCIETAPCPLLQRLITQLLDQTFKITLDPFLQPVNILGPLNDAKKAESHYSNSHEMSVGEFQYEMVYSNYDDVLSNAACFVSGADSPKIPEEPDFSESSDDDSQHSKRSSLKDAEEKESERAAENSDYS